MIIKPMRIASLNARSIFKDANRPMQKEYLSYLRSHSLHLDILCLQEVSSFHTQDHLTPMQYDHFHSFMFPSLSSALTKYCAIICLNRSLVLDDISVSMDERVLTASVLTASGSLICKIVNLYAPASRSHRPSFYASFSSLPMFSSVDSDPWLLLGDFNMNVLSSSVLRSSSLRSWLNWVDLHFKICSIDSSPTFIHADHSSTIDYIYGHTSLSTRLVNAQQHYLPSTWTDHVMLTVDLIPARVDIGPGSWRFNPLLLGDSEFCTMLDLAIPALFSSDSFVNSTDTVRWELFKSCLKQCAQVFSRMSAAKRRNNINELQQKRLCAHQDPVSAAVSSAQLEKLLDHQIVQESRQCLLRSATRWHEKGERNNKYFYRVIKERNRQQTIESLRCSSTDAILQDIPGIMNEARLFYTNLYTPDAIDSSSVESLLSNVPGDACLSVLHQESLASSILIDDLMSLVGHSPVGKSPGLDGIPFEVYKYVVPRFPCVKTLLLSVLNIALTGTFPVSWTQTRMVLLYKKGDPLFLKNWRPLSMINCDAKLFTKLLTRRFNTVLPKLINPYQTGFIQDRLISDNGWVNNTLMAHFRSVASDVPAVAVLLDQEKAYDRVHPEYLKKVLHHFGFPSSLVSSVCSLFFWY